MLVRTTCGLTVNVLILHQNTKWLISAVKMLFLILTPFCLSLKAYFSFAAEFQHAETVFRDKSGRKRNLKLERLEQRRKAEKDSERDELYAQWGKG